jgi:phosphoenolpyruvate carboxykinase (ATP)
VKQFLLRELRGWTAKDAHGEGSLPGPRADQSLLGIAQRGDRFARLLATHPIESFLVNTGSVGGVESDPRSKRIPFETSFSVVQALVDGTVQWDRQDQLGLDVPVSVPETEDQDLLTPWRLYERQGRGDEYAEEAERLRVEWRAYLAAVPPIGALENVLPSPRRRRGRSG